MCVCVCVYVCEGVREERDVCGTIWYNIFFFFLSNKIGPFINPLKSMINSAYSYSCKSKYEQLI